MDVGCSLRPDVDIDQIRGAFIDIECFTILSRDTQLIPAGRVYLGTLLNSNLWTLGAVPTQTVISI